MGVDRGELRKCRKLGSEDLVGNFMHLAGYPGRDRRKMHAWEGNEAPQVECDNCRNHKGKVGWETHYRSWHGRGIRDSYDGFAVALDDDPVVHHVRPPCRGGGRFLDRWNRWRKPESMGTWPRCRFPLSCDSAALHPYPCSRKMMAGLHSFTQGRERPDFLEA